MLIGGTAFSIAGGIKIARLLLIFEKLINNKKYISTFNNKNHNNSQQPPPGIPATAIQFRKKNSANLQIILSRKKIKK